MEGMVGKQNLAFARKTTIRQVCFWVFQVPWLFKSRHSRSLEMGDAVTNAVLFTVGAVVLLIGWGYWDKNIKPGVNTQVGLIEGIFGGTSAAGTPARVP